MAQMVRDFPSLKMTLELYIAWAQNPLPDSLVNDPTYYDPDADEDEDSDEDGNDGDDAKDGDYKDHTTQTVHRRLGDIWPRSRTQNAAKQDESILLLTHMCWNIYKLLRFCHAYVITAYRTLFHIYPLLSVCLRAH
jgi:hypothetical protein